MSENLYNGIELPDEWPPRDMDDSSYEPMPVPFLDNPPEVIPIDLGRQLFVDDFLIEKTNMERVYHLARKHAANPVLHPETPLETEEFLPSATPKDGGVWWDPQEKFFKMWYEAGWCGRLAYAVSEDGINWQRPELDAYPPTNRLDIDLFGNSGGVVFDLDSADPSQRYKMFHREGNVAMRRRETIEGINNGPGNSMVSADGIHWSEPIKSGTVGDRSTLFYNPFRKKWVYSIRGGGQGIGRARKYREHADFLRGAKWTDEEAVFWCGADRFDPPEPEIGDAAQLYNLNAVGYESLMLGLFEIHLGPDNKVCREEGHPKITELKTAFSRDGFHWHRPDRRAFIPASRRQGIWDRGYVQSVGGICLIMQDELWFYYSGFMGNAEKDIPGSEGMYFNGGTGIARLRRDGFASIRAGDKEGTLLTRPVTFSGGRLFVNTNCSDGHLKVEVCSKDGTAIPEFTKDLCRPISTDSTKTMVEWRDNPTLGRCNDRPLRFRFYLAGGDLYSFWTSDSESGESGGYVAGGGPGFSGNRDESK